MTSAFEQHELATPVPVSHANHRLSIINLVNTSESESSTPQPENITNDRHDLSKSTDIVTVTETAESPIGTSESETQSSSRSESPLRSLQIGNNQLASFEELLLNINGNGQVTPIMDIGITEAYFPVIEAKQPLQESPVSTFSTVSPFSQRTSVSSNKSNMGVLTNTLRIFSSYQKFVPLASQIAANCDSLSLGQQRRIQTGEMEMGVGCLDSIKANFDALLLHKRNLNIANAQANGNDQDEEGDYDMTGINNVEKNGVEGLTRIRNSWGAKVDELLLQPGQSPNQRSSSVDEEQEDESTLSATASANSSTNNILSRGTAVIRTNSVRATKSTSPKVTKKVTKRKSDPKMPKPTSPKVIKQAKTNPEDECTQCASRSTPEWRRGPEGPRTLCNACGLFFGKLINKYNDEGAAKEIMQKRKDSGKCFDRRVPIGI